MSSMYRTRPELDADMRRLRKIAQDISSNPAPPRIIEGEIEHVVFSFGRFGHEGENKSWIDMHVESEYLKGVFFPASLPLQKGDRIKAWISDGMWKDAHLPGDGYVTAYGIEKLNDAGDVLATYVIQ